MFHFPKKSGTFCEIFLHRIYVNSKKMKIQKEITYIHTYLNAVDWYQSPRLMAVSSGCSRYTYVCTLINPECRVYNLSVFRLKIGWCNLIGCQSYRVRSTVWNMSFWTWAEIWYEIWNMTSVSEEQKYEIWNMKIWNMKIWRAWAKIWNMKHRHKNASP